MNGWDLKRSYRIPLIYGLFSVLWILFSDKLAFAAAPDVSQAVLFSTIKGILFVVLSTLLIFILLKNDESGRQRLLDEITAVQRSFNLLFEDNPQPMWIYDNHSLEIMAVNPAACTVYGYTSSEFRKLRITDLRLKEDIPGLLDTLSEYKTELSQTGPWIHLKKDGEQMTVMVISHPLHSAGIDSTLVSVIDISEQQRTLNELDTAMQERNSFESFGYTASHDLKASLRAIIGYSEILQKEYYNRLDDEGNKFVNQIHRAGLIMNEMLDDMLILTGISHKPLSFVQVNLSEIFEEVIKTIKLEEPKRKIEITIESNMQARADEGVVRMIAQNLIQNAWKYTKNVPLAHIQAGSLVKEGDTKVFFVKDNGLGFDSSSTQNIFEPFARAHKNSAYEGMGIGLSIVRRAVERHGGQVWVESEPGKGACFYFTLQQNEQTINDSSSV